MNTLKMPPSAIEAEQSVLGALMLNNEAIDRISELHAEHFYRNDHRMIFAEITRQIAAGKTCDVITAFEGLAGNAEEVGGLSYLNALVQNTPSSANIRRYAEMVRERAIKRGLIAICGEIECRAFDSPEDSDVLVDALSSKLEQLSRATVKSEPELAQDSLAQHIEGMDAIYNGAAPLAISTGFPDLDKKLNGGLRRGNLIVLAARPKMGKSAKALNIANHIAIDGVAGVLSMEMSRKDLHDRNLASIGRIHLDHVTDPRQMTEEDWPNLTNAVRKLSEMRLYIDVQPGLTLMQVRTKAKQIKRRAGSLDVLVIDYLQLMSGDGDNRNAQIEGITRGLKNLAKELDIVIILLSQLNRELERRPNKRPVPSDLRDSGSIEQDADIVIFLYRDEVYNPDSMDRGVCEVNVSLNRQGSSGVVAMTYIGEQTRFESLHRPWCPPVPKTKAHNRGFDE